MPLFGFAAEVRIELMMPANAASIADSMNSAIFVRSTFTPRARAAPGLPPAAWIQLPTFDWVST